MSPKLTVDLGGSNARYAVISSQGVIPIVERSAPASLHELLSDIRDFAEFVDGNNVALAVAGVVQNHRSIVQSPNLPWLNGLALADSVESLNLNCWIANDMEAAGMAEIEFGELVSARCGIADTISTGIGGSICINVQGKKIVIPGEPGHTVTSSSHTVCSCGRADCVEARVSGGAIRDRVQRLLNSSDRQNVDPCATLDRAAKSHAEWALSLYKEVGRGIGLTWANTLNRISWIEKIVYSGTFAVRGMPFMRAHIEEVIRDRAMFPHHINIPIVQSAVWPHGVHLGASIVFDQCEAHQMSHASDDYETCCVDLVRRDSDFVPAVH